MISIYPGYQEKNGSEKFFEEIHKMYGLRLIPYTCGRSAMVAALQAFGLNRMDEILVPPYLGHCVLSALSRYSFPVMTPSNKTKAVLVYHQFGFPQDIDKISSIAKKNHWKIMNDCANTLHTKVNGRVLWDWGDISILSFSKIYSCGLGGALFLKDKDAVTFLKNEKYTSPTLDMKWANDSLKELVKINSGSYGIETQFKIAALYGLLPELNSFPQKSIKCLPSGPEEISEDLNHRLEVWNTIKSYFPGNVPKYDNCEVVPFAVPISGNSDLLAGISKEISIKFNVVTPTLTFDFARNMLDPDYRKSLVLGCHSGWNIQLVKDICNFIQKHF